MSETFRTGFFDALFTRGGPWFIWIYLAVLVLCVAIIFGSLPLIPENLDKKHPAMRLFDLGVDSFKIILGAVIGSLSIAAQRQWPAGRPQNTAADH